MQIDSLPSPARLRLEQLQQQRDDDRALLNSAHSAIQDNEARCHQVARVRDSATDEETIKAAIQQLDELREEHARLIQRRNQRDAQYRISSTIFGRCSDWVEQQRSDIRLRTVPSMAKAFNEDQFERKRREIADFQLDLERVSTSPLDRKTLQSMVERHVSALASSCQIRIEGERGDLPFDIKFEANAGGWHTPKALELFAWWDAKGLTARLQAAIPEADGMSLADKANATERLRAELLHAERAEEAMIKVALADGKSIARRIDADPRAILGVAVDAAKAAAA